MLMILGKNGFSFTARSSFCARGNGPARWRMPRMSSRKRSCVFGGTNANSAASRWRCLSRLSVAPLFETCLEHDDRRAAIELALRRLPPEQRDVLVLKIWGELTFEQVAAQLEIPPNTAASRYRYALTTLRRELTAADCHG
jgi:hypothetical protein